jgi:hypothetical protein
MDVDKPEVRHILEPQHADMEIESLAVPHSHATFSAELDLVLARWDSSLAWDLRLIELILQDVAKELRSPVRKIEQCAQRGVISR